MKSKRIISKPNQCDRGEQQQTKTTNQDRATVGIVAQNWN